MRTSRLLWLPKVPAFIGTFQFPHLQFFLRRRVRSGIKIELNHSLDCLCQAAHESPARPDVLEPFVSILNADHELPYILWLPMLVLPREVNVQIAQQLIEILDVIDCILCAETFGAFSRRGDSRCRLFFHRALQFSFRRPSSLSYDLTRVSQMVGIILSRNFNLCHLTFIFMRYLPLRLFGETNNAHGLTNVPSFLSTRRNGRHVVQRDSQ
jgi:hypothetical protein